jgi:hypothetical protein
VNLLQSSIILPPTCLALARVFTQLAALQLDVCKLGVYHCTVLERCICSVLSPNWLGNLKIWRSHIELKVDLTLTGCENGLSLKPNIFVATFFNFKLKISNGSMCPFEYVIARYYDQICAVIYLLKQWRAYTDILHTNLSALIFRSQ